jgi:hypothetical protein
MQEQENDRLLDGGRLGRERKLFMRELMARFGHHLALVWNLGEELSNEPEDRRAFARHLRAIDPYGSPIVAHTFPGHYDRIYEPLLGEAAFDGASLQMADMELVHVETKKWIERSRRAGRPWYVTLDEIGPPPLGVAPDSVDPGHDRVRHHALWGHLMAGGGGVEWYFGFGHPNGDRTCEDFRSRAEMWRQTRVALDFFATQLPFSRMWSDDGLVALAPGPAAAAAPAPASGPMSRAQPFCLADPGQIYAVYLPPGGAEATLDLGSAVDEFSVSWFDPRGGGALREGNVTRIEGPGRQRLGRPPIDPMRDWVALVKRIDSPPASRGGAVLRFSLVDAASGHALPGFATLADGAVIDRARLPVTPVDLRAYTAPAQAGSVRFDLDGKIGFRTKSTAPFVLFGWARTGAAVWPLADGDHVLVATPFAEGGADGEAGRPATLRLKVIDSRGRAPAAPSTPSR